MAANKGGNTVAKAFQLAQPLADELGLFLWDVCFEKEGANWYLRVYIDKDEGISLDDCEAFSRPFNKILDDEDFIDGSYIFEVGSPGLGRELKRSEHFECYLGDDVRVRLIRAVDGIKEYTGELLSYTKDSVTIGVDGTEKEIRISDTAYIKAADDDFFEEN